jgi:hypothetical protein
VIEALTGPDDVRRAAALRAVPGLPSPLPRLVATRLLPLLSSGNEPLLSQVSAALVSIGRPGSWVLGCHLLTTEDVPLQIALVGILGAIARTIGDEEERMLVRGRS